MNKKYEERIKELEEQIDYQSAWLMVLSVRIMNLERKNEFPNFTELDTWMEILFNQVNNVLLDNKRMKEIESRISEPFEIR